MSALRQAVAALDTGRVGALLLRADVRERDSAGRTLLHEVCDAAPHDLQAARVIARLLVRSGASTQDLDDFGRTPLDVACERGVDQAMGLAMAAGLGVGLMPPPTMARVEHVA